VTDDSESNSNTTVENDELAAEVAPKRGKLVWALLVLASVIAIGSSLNVWAQKQVLNTDRWVEASNELLADDEVRGALATFLVDELYNNVDVSGELADTLPGDFQGLAGVLTAALRGPATEGVDRLLSTPAARGVWDTANRKAHETIVAILRDETTVVSTTDGVVTLELGDLVRDLGEDLGLPSGLIDAIPADTGEIVLFESSELEQAQQIVRVIEFFSVLLFIVVAGLYAGAVFLSDKSQRRATLRDVGWAITVSGLIILLLRQAGIGLAIGYLAEVESAEPLSRSGLSCCARWRGPVSLLVC